MSKLNKYYLRTAASNAHLMAMGELSFFLHFYVTNAQVAQTVLNPTMKMVYFINNWPSNLVLEVEGVIEKLVSCFLCVLVPLTQFLL